MLRKILLAAGIFLLFDIAVVVAILFTLPTDFIRHFAKQTIEKALKQEHSIEIEKISISPLLNVTATDFRMTPRSHEEINSNFATAGGNFQGYDCAPYIEKETVVIDEIFVNPKIFKILRKKPEGEFEIKIQGGLIHGELRSVNKSFEITAEGDGIDLSQFTLMSNYTGAQIYGNLGFEMRAVLDSNSDKKGAGMIQELRASVSASSTAMCPKRIKLNVSSMPFIEMPFTVFGDISAVIELQKDRIVIESLTTTGPDIKLDVSGDVTLKDEKNPDPSLNITATIQPSETWIAENNMGAIYKLCQKHDDGSIELTLSGTTKRLKHDCGTPVPDLDPVPPSADNPDPPQDDTHPTDAPKPSEPVPDKNPTAPPVQHPTASDTEQTIPSEIRRGNRTVTPRSTRGIEDKPTDRIDLTLRGDSRPTRVMPGHPSPSNELLNQRLDAEIEKGLQKSPRTQERARFDAQRRGDD